ncbi:MAG TPA: hypothetical protein VF322_04735 [Gammaproteobacteria bacterium]
MARKKRRESLDEIILRIHAASLEEELWPSVLDGVCSLINAESAGGMRYHAGTGKLAWLTSVGHDVDMWSEYHEYWVTRDEWLLGALGTSRIQIGIVSRDEDLVDRRASLNSSSRSDLSPVFAVSLELD